MSRRGCHSQLHLTIWEYVGYERNIKTAGYVEGGKQEGENGELFVPWF